jgi:uncharacterized protein YciI
MKISLLSLIFLASVICRAQDQYSFVFLHKKPDATSIPKEELDKIMQGHLANIERLAAEDKLKVAGPFEGGGGIFILNTTSVDEATLWLSTDPGIQAKRWNVEILSYTTQLGSVCSAKEPYEMVMYHFIRFHRVPKAEIKNADALLKEHTRYVEKLQLDGNVITSGAFKPNGDILILKGDLKKELTGSDPAVRAGILFVDQKKLWIAKGSFCEK